MDGADLDQGGMVVLRPRAAPSVTRDRRRRGSRDARSCSLDGWRTTAATTGSSGASSRRWATRSSAERPPADAVAAVGWWNLLARLGLAAAARRGARLRAGAVGRAVGVAARGDARRRVPAAACSPRYQALLARFAETETIEELGTTPLGDETLAVILARVVGDIYLRWHGRSRLPDAGALPTSGPAYELDRPSWRALHDPAWALPFIQRLCEQERTLLARLQQIELSAVRLFGLFPDRGHRRRPGRPVSRRRDRGRRGRRRFFAAADAVAARDQAPARARSASRSTATPRSSGAATSTRCCPASWRTTTTLFVLKALSDDLLYYGHERQNEVVAPAALHPRRRQRVDARRPRGVRARAGAGAGEEAVAGRGQERRRLGPLLRQPPAPAHRSRPVGAPRSAAAAQLSFAARPELRARVRRPGRRGRPPGARRRGATSRSRSSPTAPARSRSRRSRRWRRRRGCTASSCCRRARWSSTTCRSCTGARS